MNTTIYYVVRSKLDGQYLAAHPNPDTAEKYILLFSENYDALSYLNKFAGDLKDKLAVESILPMQLKSMMQRWGYTGVGFVRDPLIPKVEFLAQTQW